MLFLPCWLEFSSLWKKREGSHSMISPVIALRFLKKEKLQMFPQINFSEEGRGPSEMFVWFWAFSGLCKQNRASKNVSDFLAP